MGSTPTYDLYIDDSGTRRLDAPKVASHSTAPDAFALGGILIGSEAATLVIDGVQALKQRCGITSYLRSYEIRQKKGKYAWIEKEPERATRLYSEIHLLIEQMPGWATAVVIDRSGYNARYADKYGTDRWELCRSAYDILIERAAKIADADGRRLKVFVEGTGKREDRLICQYHSNLRENGLGFQVSTSEKYRPLTAGDFTRITMKHPAFTRKGNPLSDLADLVLFPLVVGKYDPSYKPYRFLQETGKIIDCRLSDGPSDCGVKYYCFDDPNLGETPKSEKAGAR